MKLIKITPRKYQVVQHQPFPWEDGVKLLVWGYIIFLIIIKIPTPQAVEAQDVLETTPATTTTPSPTPTVAPTPTPAPTATPTPIRSEIEQYVYEVFGEHAEKGLYMLRECENKSLDPHAINVWNRNGSVDTGLWQINSIHGYPQEKLLDYKYNTDRAYEIFTRAGGFSPWTCSHVIGVKSFWQ